MGGENVYFIPQYLSNRTVMQKIFDPHANDNGTYQARELSYFIDYVDAKFFLFLLSFGFTLFIPLSALVSSLLIIIIYFIGARKTLPHLDLLTSGLVLLLFLTSFVYVSTMGLFYRSGKLLLAPATLALLFFALWADKNRRTSKARALPSGFSITRHSVATFFICVFMGLLDRQGFFYIIIACAVLLLHFILRGRLKDFLIGALTSAAFVHIYDLYIGPRIVHAVNGYWPSFEYQNILYERLITEPSIFFKAFKILLDNAIALFGGGYCVSSIFLGTAIAGLTIKLRLVLATLVERDESYSQLLKKNIKHLSVSYYAPVVYALTILGLHILMFSLMIIRHREIYDYIDHRYWYHPLSYITIIVFAIALALNRFLHLMTGKQLQIMRFLLLLIIGTNLFNLQFYKTQMLSSNWFMPYVYSQSELLKRSIRDGTANAQLTEKHRRFYSLYLERKEAPAN